MYELLFRHVLSRIPPEAAHHLGFGGLRALMALPFVKSLVRRQLAPTSPLLAVRALGLDFPGPLGLAAGFDKDARGPDALGALGFG
ncbi:MAG: dihydroorotate dehydrogenase (quinone), partial [Deltaproteobacteria bacterium]|nr:dihydroorotate dehydrogenase (quinone) [Deltaproteobacteria bacterium]